jgi:arginine deiminase
MKVNLSSEIGTLQEVIIHSPGPEVENMTPQNAKRALYSEILNLSIVSSEYVQFKFEVRQLLKESLQVKEVRERLLELICSNKHIETLCKYLLELQSADLACQLIEGVPLSGARNGNNGIVGQIFLHSLQEKCSGIDEMFIHWTHLPNMVLA